MNDETNSAETKTETPPPLEPSRSFELTADSRQTLMHWLKRLFACNPFYLVSAALLLFGMYRVSIETSFLPTEVARLTFNFSSLQVYELLLVGVAVVLAGRAIWYDAKLLLVLENLLWLVPFILISQAALINLHTLWVLSLATALVAAIRFGAVQRWIPATRVPPRLLYCGLAVLVVNTALPICYRIFQETKYGVDPTWGAAYHMNRWSWFLLLPALVALLNLLPRLHGQGEATTGRRWLPLGTYLLWLVGTGVHLYCLGYVYDFKLSRVLLAPTLWILAWTFGRRMTDFIPEPAREVKVMGLLLPLGAALAAAGPGSNAVFFVLNLLNVLVFAGIVFADRQNRLALHLLLVSLTVAMAGLPQEWTQSAVIEFSRGKFVAMAALAYLILGTALSPNPKLAILGAFAASFAVGTFCGERNDAVHWAIQAGLVFFLLHSLRWRDDEHEGAALARVLTGIAWVLHSFVWVRCGAEFLQPFSIGAMVLVIWLTQGFVFSKWSPMVVPVAALMVATCSPMNLAITSLRTVPTGVVIIGASFLLFALGTVAALTRHRWHKY